MSELHLYGSMVPVAKQEELKLCYSWHKGFALFRTKFHHGLSCTMLLFFISNIKTPHHLIVGCSLSSQLSVFDLMAKDQQFSINSISLFFRKLKAKFLTCCLFTKRGTGTREKSTVFNLVDYWLIINITDWAWTATTCCGCPTCTGGRVGPTFRPCSPPHSTLPRASSSRVSSIFGLG